LKPSGSLSGCAKNVLPLPQFVTADSSSAGIKPLTLSITAFPLPRKVLNCWEEIEEIEKETETVGGKRTAIYEADVRKIDGSKIEIKVREDDKFINIDKD
jgi:hypothetical protein